MADASFGELMTSGKTHTLKVLTVGLHSLVDSRDFFSGVRRMSDPFSGGTNDNCRRSVGSESGK